MENKWETEVLKKKKYEQADRLQDSCIKWQIETKCAFVSFSTQILVMINTEWQS